MEPGKHPGGIRDNMLHIIAGAVDEAEDAVAVNEAVHQFLFFRALGMDGDVADAFTGQPPGL